MTIRTEQIVLLVFLWKFYQNPARQFARILVIVLISFSFVKKKNDFRNEVYQEGLASPSIRSLKKIKIYQKNDANSRQSILRLEKACRAKNLYLNGTGCLTRIFEEILINFF